MKLLDPWRLTLLATLAVAASAAAVGWALVSRPLDPPTIDGARVLAPGESDGSHEAAELATPRRIEVDFTTVGDLAKIRSRRGLGAISAVLSACDASAWAAEQVITQRADYFADRGRAHRLGAVGEGGRTRYRAVFDDRLTRMADHAFQREPALGQPGGLCLSLHGGGLGPLQISSTAVRVPNLP